MAERRPARGRAPVICSLAPAKLNLYLHVTGKRADGYHQLESLIAFAGVCDMVGVEAAPELSLAIGGARGSDVPLGKANLVMTAAARLREEAGIAAGAALRLIKKLPVASGIGGGSADAGAALRVLARLWDIESDSAALNRIALEIGADVPVCLHCETALVSGIGEVMTPVSPLPPAWLLLVNPGIELSTAQVFAARDGAFSEPVPFPAQPFPDAEALAAVLHQRRNDLTDAARCLVPEVGTAIEALEKWPGALLARMSGSGATCFALFARRREAEAAAAALAGEHPDWWVEPAPLLNAAVPTA